MSGSSLWTLKFLLKKFLLWNTSLSGNKTDESRSMPLTLSPKLYFTFIILPLLLLNSLHIMHFFSTVSTNRVSGIWEYSLKKKKRLKVWFSYKVMKECLFFLNAWMDSCLTPNFYHFKDLYRRNINYVANHLNYLQDNKSIIYENSTP